MNQPPGTCRIILLLLTSAWLAFTGLSCQKQSTSSGNTQPSGPPDQLSGYLYIATDHPKTFISYSLTAGTFNNMIDPGIPLRAAAISGNGKFFAYLTSDTALTTVDLSNSVARHHHLTYPVLGQISLNEKGTIMAYSGLYDQRSALIFYFPEDRRSQAMATSDVVDFHFRNPLFARFGNTLAVKSDSGLFVGFEPKFTLHRLTRQRLTPVDISPSARYLAAGNRLFDLQRLEPYPSIFNGKMQFVDDDELVYRDTGGRQLILTDIAGLKPVSLLGAKTPILDFAVSTYGVNLVYVEREAHQFKLSFFAIRTRELKREVWYPAADSTTIHALYWRSRFWPY